MAAELTLLIPNYERPAALRRLLDGVYASIGMANAWSRVHVAVIDDFSQADLSAIVDTFSRFSNFTFALQKKKCGNAERAFLEALQEISTPYVWLLGNDDQIAVEAVAKVLDLLRFEVGLILLNPRIVAGEESLTPIITTSKIVFYDRCEILFQDFGFVTSTTTFSCLVVKTSNLKSFHERTPLTKIATVYSHTFSMFCSYFNSPGLFYAEPIVSFSMNSLPDEKEKLERQVQNSFVFSHQSLSLARLVRRCSALTGVPVANLGSAQEDELSKTTLQICPTFLSHFIARFLVEQLRWEHSRQSRTAPQFRDMSESELAEILAVIQECGDPKLLALCERAAGWSRAPRFMSAIVRRALERSLKRLRMLVREKRQTFVRAMPADERKLYPTTGDFTPIAGSGRPLAD